MGYYTRYNLTITNDEAGSIMDELRETDGARYALTDTGGCSDSCKWYNHETEMKEFSKKYPKSVFELTGHGEGDGDIWTKYFKDGKMQVSKAKITCEPFNPNKLQ